MAEFLLVFFIITAAIFSTAGARPAFYTRGVIPNWVGSYGSPMDESPHLGRRPVFNTRLDANPQVASVIPDWVDAYNVLRPSLDVKYGSQSISVGMSLPGSATRVAPTVSISDPSSKQGDLFTLLMVDPDALSPQNPTWRNYVHWIVTNIPNGSTDVAKQGAQVTDYLMPQPPVGTQRYYLLLFKQKSKITVDPFTDPGNDNGQPWATPRQGFSVRSFSDHYELGFPVAGTYFTVTSPTVP